MPQKKKRSDATELNQRPKRVKSKVSGGMVFAPGVSGNPKGRPAGSKNFSTMVRGLLSGLSQAKDANGELMTYEATLAKTVLKKAIVDEDFNTIKLIWNYMDGFPVQPLGGSVDVKTELDAETKAKIDNIFNRNMRRVK